MIDESDIDELAAEAAAEDSRQLINKADELNENIAELATDGVAIGSLLEADDG